MVNYWNSNPSYVVQSLSASLRYHFTGAALPHVCSLWSFSLRLRPLSLPQKKYGNFKFNMISDLINQYLKHFNTLKFLIELSKFIISTWKRKFVVKLSWWRGIKKKKEDFLSMYNSAMVGLWIIWIQINSNKLMNKVLYFFLGEMNVGCSFASRSPSLGWNFILAKKIKISVVYFFKKWAY